MNTAKIFIISGTTASGKTTVVDQFLQHTALPFAKITTCTTRTKRDGEQDGVDYHFLSTEDFEKKIHEKFFLEWARVHDNLYGTPLDQVEAELAKGNNSILVIDVQGALEVKTIRPDAVLIFIKAENIEQIKERIIKRHGSAPDDLEVRLASAEKELAKAGAYDYQITNANGKLDETVARLAQIISQEVA